MAYRSRFEQAVANSLDIQSIPYLYESSTHEYTLTSKYLIDFELATGIILEAKGYFPPKDRRKMLAMKKQHPELDIRMVFQRDQKLSKNSKTTYGMWCTKHDIPWCVYPNIPPDWLN